VNLHPTHTAEERRRFFHLGIELFNRGEYFEAHEAWEEIWRSTAPEPKTLFQGLIQCAAGLHQIRDLHRQAGPRKTLAKARLNLESYAPVACGLDVAGLLAEIGRWQEWLESPGSETPAWPAVRVVDWGAVA
jgi:predicted metal-dependent hydrolase